MFLYISNEEYTRIAVLLETSPMKLTRKQFNSIMKGLVWHAIIRVPNYSFYAK
jgi:hypothetical protein